MSAIPREHVAVLIIDLSESGIETELRDEL